MKADSPTKLLRQIRKRYKLALEGGKLVLSGPKPRDPAKALASLEANKSELVALLVAEQQPAVAAAIDLLGAVLVEVRQKPMAANPAQGAALQHHGVTHGVTKRHET